MNESEDRRRKLQPFECPICGGILSLRAFMEDYLLDWQGEPERDIDGIPLLIEWACYTCLMCGEPQKRVHRYLSDDENPEVSK